MQSGYKNKAHSYVNVHGHDRNTLTNAEYENKGPYHLNVCAFLSSLNQFIKKCVVTNNI